MRTSAEKLATGPERPAVQLLGTGGDVVHDGIFEHVLGHEIEESREVAEHHYVGNDLSSHLFGRLSEGHCGRALGQDEVAVDHHGAVFGQLAGVGVIRRLRQSDQHVRPRHPRVVDGFGRDDNFRTGGAAARFGAVGLGLNGFESGAGRGLAEDHAGKHDPLPSETADPYFFLHLISALGSSAFGR